MRPLPKDRDLLLRLLDEIKAISAGLANELLDIEMEMKHETELREIFRGFSTDEQFGKIAKVGIGSAQFQKRLRHFDDVAVAHLSSLGEYLPEKEVALLLDENDRCRAECRPDWDSAAGTLSFLHASDGKTRLQALFAARDTLIRIVRVRMRVFKGLTVMVTRLRQRVERVLTETVGSIGDDTNDNKGKSRKRGMQKDEANVRVSEFLKKWFADNPNAKQMSAQRTIADAVGCANGTVGGLPSYRAVAERFPRSQVGPRRPKAIPLTDKVLATAGEGQPGDVLDKLVAKEEQELQRLIAEQNREAERDPSPLEVDQPDRRRTAKEHKKV
jgi:hypothetical protein